MKLSADVSDFEGRIYRRFWFEVFLGAFRGLLSGCEVSMDVPFYGDTIGGRVRPRRPKILLSFHGGILVLATQFTVLQKEQTYVVTTKLFPGVVDTGQK